MTGNYAKQNYVEALGVVNANGSGYVHPPIIEELKLAAVAYGKSHLDNAAEQLSADMNAPTLTNMDAAAAIAAGLAATGDKKKALPALWSKLEELENISATRRDGWRGDASFRAAILTAIGELGDGEDAKKIASRLSAQREFYLSMNPGSSNYSLQDYGDRAIKAILVRHPEESQQVLAIFAETQKQDQIDKSHAGRLKQRDNEIRHTSRSSHEFPRAEGDVRRDPLSSEGGYNRW